MVSGKPKTPILNPSHPLARGLVGAWLMYEGVGTSINNLSPHRGAGTLSGPTWGGNRSLVFTNGNYVNSNEASLYQFVGSNFTLFMRAKLGTAPTHHGFFFTLNFAGNTGWGLRSEGNTSQYKFVIGNTLYTVNSGISLNNGAWHDYAIVVRASSNVQSFLDGVSVHTVAATKAISNSSRNLYIGAEQGVAYGLVGDVSCTHVYNRALTTREISSLHTDPYQAFRTAPLWVPTFTAGGGSPPTAPSDLTATATGTTTIDLGWTDNSGDETGFKIERGTDGVVFAQIDTAAADATTYNDTGLTANTLYYYRVRAYNGSGDSSYSNTASATTDSDFMPRHGAVMLSSGVAIV